MELDLDTLQQLPAEEDHTGICGYTCRTTCDSTCVVSGQ